jgi:DNA polymerase III delta prime subunit
MSLIEIKNSTINKFKIEMECIRTQAAQDKELYTQVEKKFFKNIAYLEQSKLELLQKIKYYNFDISKKDKQIIQLEMKAKFSS